MQPLASVAMLVAVSLVAASAAQAQSEEAEALIREATELRRQDHDERALPLYERAYKLSRTPRTAAQLGLVEMALGYWTDSERYLIEALSSPDHPWVAKNLAVLNNALAAIRTKIAELTVAGDPRDAVVAINGKVVGRLPLAGPIRLGQGRVDVAVTAPGYVRDGRTLTLVGGSAQRLRIALVRATDQGAAFGGGAGQTTALQENGAVGDGDGSAATAAASRPAAQRTAATEHGTSQGTQSAPRGGGRRTAAWIVGAAAVAGLTFGVVETVTTIRRKDDFVRHTTIVGGSPMQDCATSMLTPECKRLADSHGKALKLAIAGYVAGGTLAVASVVLFILTAPRDEDPAISAGAPIACAPDLGLHGLGCQLQF